MKHGNLLSIARMADEFNRVDFLSIGFRPAYKNNL